MSVQTQLVEYSDRGTLMEGFLAIDSKRGNALPVVLIAHAWAGQGELERSKAKAIAELGYAAFAVDLYGKANRGKNADENNALMTPFLEDRERIVAGLKAAISTVSGLPGVDAGRIAAIGYCFGGLCVLDLARSGADLCGVVSIHGLFHPSSLPSPGIQAKVLALHGWDDPMVPTEQVVALGHELSAAGADWRLHAYGNTMHAFSNPNANDPGFGTVYNALTDRRAWQALQNFLAEVFTP